MRVRRSPPGDVLFQIDPTIYDAAWRGAQARLAQAQARLDNADAHARAAQAAARASTPWRRRMWTTREAAEAQARAAVDDAKASVDRARKDLNDADVKAEIAGRVGKANLMLGARVTGPADLLTTIDVLDPVRVTFRPSTQQVLAWRRDPRASQALQAGGSARVQIVLPDGTDLSPRPASSTLSSPVVDSATGTQEFRAEVANHAASAGAGTIRPGATSRGWCATARILVPQRAVVPVARPAVGLSCWAPATRCAAATCTPRPGWASAGWSIRGWSPAIASLSTACRRCGRAAWRTPPVRRQQAVSAVSTPGRRRRRATSSTSSSAVR